MGKRGAPRRRSNDALTSPLLGDSLLREQIQLERHAIDEGVKRYNEGVAATVERGEGHMLKPAERMLLHWYDPLREAIKEELRACDRTHGIQKQPGRTIYAPVLRLISVDKLAVITMQVVTSRLIAMPQGERLTLMAYSIGRAVFAEANMQLIEKSKTKKAEFRKLTERIRKLTPTRINWWSKRELDEPVWEQRACVYVGTCLLWLLMSTASAADYTMGFELAFHHEMRTLGRPRRAAFITMDPKVYELIDDGHAIRKFLRPKYLPMIVPPYPWTSDSEGGYTRIRTPFVTKPRPPHKKLLETADLTRVHESLNAVNATPWRINGHMFEIVEAFYESGGGAMRVPPKHDTPLPPMPPGFEVDAPDGHRWKGVDEEPKKQWRLEANPIYRHNRKMAAERRQFQMKLETTRLVQHREKLYFPHLLDFRSRMYPIPSHINHQGDDVNRGILEFAVGKPLGNGGLRWLMIHAANTYGIDKVSFDDRVRWAKEQANMFARTAVLADNPDELFAFDWWQKADKPWQFLASCLELGQALSSEAPAAYESHLPVQNDGTCNGLQHYAALGRDAIGGASVNLVPQDQPSDVYAEVAKVVKQAVMDDAAGGNQLAADAVEWVSRKTVKRVTMTTPYGVTQVGAKNQVLEVLEELGYPNDNMQRYKAARYLSQQVIRGIGQLVSSASEIMHWLRACARLIAEKPHSDVVSWTTPMGFPVMQPYRKWKTVHMHTPLGAMVISIPDANVPAKIGKNYNSFPPNFIHSIDASHMMMVATEAYRAGITFGAVHDSYWTHACDVDMLQKMIRTNFVQLHERPLIKELHQDFSNRYPDLDFPDPPAQGSLALDVVLTSDYFFS